VALTSVRPRSITWLVVHTSDVIVFDVARISMPSSWSSDAMMTSLRSANQRRHCNAAQYHVDLSADNVQQYITHYVAVKIKKKYLKTWKLRCIATSTSRLSFWYVFSKTRTAHAQKLLFPGFQSNFRHRHYRFSGRDFLKETNNLAIRRRFQVFTLHCTDQTFDMFLSDIMKLSTCHMLRSAPG